MPSTPGMSRSISTTSGLSAVACATASSPSAAVPASSMPSCAPISRAEARRGSRRGRRRRARGSRQLSSMTTVVPAPGCERTSSRASRPRHGPSSQEARDRRGPPPAALLALGGVEAAAVVGDLEPLPGDDARSTFDAHRRAWSRCAAPRGRRGRRARRPSCPSAPPSTRQRCRHPAACSGLSRSLSAASRPALSRLGGWISTSSVRRSRTAWRRRRWLGQRPRSLVIAGALGLVGERREPERHPGDVLDDAVVQVGRDAPPLGVGRIDATALGSAALQPTGERRPAAPGAAAGRRGRRAAAAPVAPAAGRRRR